MPCLPFCSPSVFIFPLPPLSLSIGSADARNSFSSHGGVNAAPMIMCFFRIFSLRAAYKFSASSVPSIFFCHSLNSLFSSTSIYTSLSAAEFLWKSLGFCRFYCLRKNASNFMYLRQPANLMPNYAVLIKKGRRRLATEGARTRFARAMESIEHLPFDKSVASIRGHVGTQVRYYFELNCVHYRLFLYCFNYFIVLRSFRFK